MFFNVYSCFYFFYFRNGKQEITPTPNKYDNNPYKHETPIISVSKKPTPQVIKQTNMNKNKQTNTNKHEHKQTNMNKQTWTNNEQTQT